MKAKIKRVHSLQWIADLLQDDPTFLQKKMFGCEALYLNHKLSFMLAASEEPWNGLLVCTSRECHDSLMGEFPELISHPVLGKWLYVSQAHPDFERITQRVAEKALSADPRIGIESKSRPRKRD